MTKKGHYQLSHQYRPNRGREGGTYGEEVSTDCEGVGGRCGTSSRT
jgi:hypothetical protein